MKASCCEGILQLHRATCTGGAIAMAETKAGRKGKPGGDFLLVAVAMLRKVTARVRDIHMFFGVCQTVSGTGSPMA